MSSNRPAKSRKKRGASPSWRGDQPPDKRRSLSKQFSPARKGSTTRLASTPYAIPKMNMVDHISTYDHSSVHIGDNHYYQATITKLPIAKGASFDSFDNQHDPKCHLNTRIDLLAQIYGWADGSDGQCIYWLQGMAGTGKSTISRTVACNLADKGLLGASFFFKRGEGDRGKAARFFTTITAQLVRKLPSLEQHIRDAIEDDPAITGKAMREQFEKLIIQPLKNVASDGQNHLRVVVVVDALNECDREDDVKRIIYLLSQTKHLASSIPLKFFVTSRPELPIRLGFEDINGQYDNLILHQIPKPIIEHDISAFLMFKMEQIRGEFNKTVPNHRRLPVDWCWIDFLSLPKFV